MSIHPSLSGSKKEKVRSVLTRIERIRTMLEKGTWKEGDRVYGLPKIKTIKIKIKKEKAEKAETTADGATAAPAAGDAKAASKAAPAKQEKK